MLSYYTLAIYNQDSHGGNGEPVTIRLKDADELKEKLAEAKKHPHYFAHRVFYTHELPDLRGAA